MTEKRIPKAGEVWVGDDPDQTRTVVNVYPDAVTYIGFDHQLYGDTLDAFLEYSNPPEPTVVFDTHIKVDDSGIDVDAAIRNCTHVIQAMSDGEVRVVKL